MTSGPRVVFLWRIEPRCHVAVREAWKLPDVSMVVGTVTRGAPLAVSRDGAQQWCIARRSEDHSRVRVFELRRLRHQNRRASQEEIRFALRTARSGHIQA